MEQNRVSRQVSDTAPPTYEELLQEKEALCNRVYELSCVEKEKALCLEYIGQLEQRIRMLEDQLNYERMGAQRSVADVQELAMLREHKRQWLEIFSIPGKTPADKLALWAVAHEIEDHPTRKREDGFSPVFNDDIAARVGISTDTLSKSWAEWKTAGTILRKDEKEGQKTKMFFALNEEHMRHARENIKPDPNAKKQGGDRRCPQCGQYCKKIVQIGYVCPPCGLDFDRDMNPIDHTALLQMSKGKSEIISGNEEGEAVKTFTEADLEKEPVTEPSNVLQFPLIPSTPYGPRCSKHHTDKQKALSGRWVCPFCEPGRLGYGGTA